MRERLHAFRLATVTALMTGCGGGGDPASPPPAPGQTIAVIKVAAATTVPGGSIPRAARAEDASGNAVSTSFAWTSDQPGVASVSPSGIVTGGSAGTTTLRASAGGKTGTATITVADLRWAVLPQPGFSSCGLTTSGALYCWGSATGGVGGPAADADHESCPQSANDWCYSTPRLLSFSRQFTTIAVGRTHACGLTATGDAWCWGSNDVGQLGAPTTETCAFPGQVAGPMPCSRQPVTVTGGRQFVSLVANRHTCGLTAGGEAWCWGQNDHGQLGSAGTTAPSSQVPVRAAAPLLFDALATGYLHTCGISRDGQTYCWGDDPALGSVRSEGAQATVVAGGHAFTAISAGDALTCGLTGAGLAYCWGQGGQGQLGNGGMADAVTPVAVAGGKIFRSISAGHFYACALDIGSKAWCWGLNFDGNLGTGSPGPVACGDATCATTPLAVAGNITFSSLDAGNWVTCGISTAQRAYCWGRNTFGGIGNGKVGGNNEPAPTGVAGAPQ